MGNFGFYGEKSPFKFEKVVKVNTKYFLKNKDY